MCLCLFKTNRDVKVLRIKFTLSPNMEKYRPGKTPHLDNFHAVNSFHNF